MSVDAAAWYAVQTKPREETKALGFLARKTIPGFLPRLLVQRRHGSRRWQALEPLFPGYLFVHIAPEPGALDQVRWTPGVRRILGNDEHPVAVPDDVISFLQERVGARGFIEPDPSILPGTRVRFLEGPFAHLEGLAERGGPRAKRVRVLLSLMNAHVSVEADVADLEQA